MKKFFLYTLLTLILVMWLPLAASAQPVPKEILEKIDANMAIETAEMRARMTINYKDGDARTLEFNSWSVGADQSFLEFTSPSRDAGSRYLRLEDNMWIYLPRVGKSVRIQGHMLRQGMMGSDFSYGDASEQPSMVDDYDAVIEKEEDFEGRPTYVLYLTGNKKSLAYPMRRLWVDAERWVPLKEERFARSGKLLKTAVLSDVRQIGSRWYPFKTELDNALQSDTSTILQVLELTMNVQLADEIFTLRNLEDGL
ncbi:MAG: outer membrane lipoprotein-sorting protein [Rhodothermales bacterium]